MIIGLRCESSGVSKKVNVGVNRKAGRGLVERPMVMVGEGNKIGRVRMRMPVEVRKRFNQRLVEGARR